LRAMNQLRVPVVSVDGRCAYAGDLDEVADFLGIARTGHRMLPPAQLLEKYDAILAAGQRYLGAFPPDRLAMTVPRREKRDMRELGYHVFAITEDLMRVKDGDEYVQGTGPVPGDVRSFDDIISYGEDVRLRLRRWFSSQSTDFWTQTRTTSYGAFPMHKYLERATWHSGQHVRQILEMSHAAGIDIRDALPATVFAGLPIPQNIWD
ncbi:MAG: DinB family protein, partial [Vulcanimicrobiaceae bacterium]